MTSSAGAPDSVVSLQGNDLSELPPTIGNLRAVKQLSVADNALPTVPDSIAALPSLASLWLYGNTLTAVPATLARAPVLRNLWLEGEAVPKARLLGEPGPFSVQSHLRLAVQSGPV